MSIKKTAIIGCGVMGTGISQEIAVNGIDCLLYGRNPEKVAASREKTRANLMRRVSKGKMTQEQVDEAMSHLSITSNVEDVYDADLVIEAVSEDLELKMDFFERLSRICRPDAILATNTSSLSITKIASRTQNPDRVLGTHFFNPPSAMKLVEIIKGEKTSEETYAETRAFCEQIKRVCVRLNRDTPGFIVNRVLFAYFLECVHIYEEGIASKEDIDTAIRYGLNHPLGPFHLMDMGGLDNFPAVCESLQEINEDRFACPAPILEMKAAGKYGTKSGEGWYTYG